MKIWSAKTKNFKYFLITGGDKGVVRTFDLSLEEPIFKDHTYIKFEPILRIMYKNRYMTYLLIINRKYYGNQRIGVISSEQTITILQYDLNDNEEIEFKILSQICGYNDEVIDTKFIKRINYKEELLNMDNLIVYATNSSQIK